MARYSIGATVVGFVSLILVGSFSSSHAGGPRLNSIERFGLGGYIQAAGLHHGFHVETVTADSAAARDRLMPHDIIVKVDGDAIRNLDHLRAVLAEAYLDDGEVTITYLRGTSLEHRELKCNVKQATVKPVGSRRNKDLEEVDR